MINEQLQNKLLDQVRLEWESEFYYLQMMAWCYNHDYEGFGNWFYAQANEERDHGMRILSFLTEIGGALAIPSVNVPEAEFTGIEEIFERVLGHEEKVTVQVHKLVSMAIEQNDHSTNNFLQWFVKEQIEEESSVRAILAKVRRAAGTPAALLMIENDIAQARNVSLPGWGDPS